ncbi:MAG TPA: RNA methyltransferase [Candidatus Cybelea sp.]|jgi:TrmH family RNA methyltransferase|nr:RNA methyltransferase [Candidatus Cybelea sp.]
MATRLGNRAERLSAVRALRSVKGRREQRRFAFEGATMLAEAARSDFPIAELYVTDAAYEGVRLVRELEASGIPAFLVAPGAAESISDVATPSGIVAVGPARLSDTPELFGSGTPLMILADLGDPGNAGTLLRSADAFGCAGVLFGAKGVDPYHPKVVRGSMGAVFRLPIGVASLGEAAAAAVAAGVRIWGLATGGTSLNDEAWPALLALAIGHERRGLGEWESSCERTVAIPMIGAAESLSAGVAGSIALYEASKKAGESKRCQESVSGAKSQDYRC